MLYCIYSELSGAPLRVLLCCLQLPGLLRLCASLLLAQYCSMLRFSHVRQSVVLTDVSAVPSVGAVQSPLTVPMLHISIALFFLSPSPILSPLFLALSFLEGTVVGVISMHTASEQPHLPASQLQSGFSKSYVYIAQLSLPYQ